MGLARPAVWRHEDLTGARQLTAIPKVQKLGHLISRHSPSKERVSAWCPDCGPQVSRLESIKTSGVLALIVPGGGVMTAAARDEPVHDQTYLPREDDAEIIDFLSALRDRGGQPAGARPRLVGPDGQSVELPESMFGVLLQVAAAMKAGLAVTPVLEKWGEFDTLFGAISKARPASGRAGFSSGAL